MSAARWRVPAALVSILLMVGATACGDDKPAATADSSTSTSHAQEESSTSTAAPTSTTVKVSLVTLTPAALGGLHLGMSQAEAVATGLIGAFGPGCELAGPDQKGAELKAPLQGSVLADASGVTDIYVTAGAVTDPGGVKIGSPLTAVQGAFGAAYDVTVDKSVQDMFGEWFVYVAEKGKGEGQTTFDFSVDPKTQLVTGLGAPSIPTCE
jgi:hypothetical protein